MTSTLGARRAGISAPTSEQTVKQWEVKSSFAREADAASRQLLEAGMVKLAAMAPAADLWCSIRWRGLARIWSPPSRLGRAGREVEAQARLPGPARRRQLLCRRDLPSVGYRSYRRLFQTEPFGDAVFSAEGQMENEFYRVSLDATNGALKSILDKETGRELIDPDSEYRLGELIYVSGGEGSYAVHSDLRGRAATEVHVSPAEAARVTQVNGPVFGELASEATADMFPKITLRVRLYKVSSV